MIITSQNKTYHVISDTISIMASSSSTVEIASSAATIEAGGKKVLVRLVGEPKWDPFTSPDWDQEAHSKDAVVRIKRDLQTIYTDPAPGICVVPQGDDITRLHVLITGPFDTPYEGGYFHFLVRFPPTYPLVAPRVKFMTTGGGLVRFNPNLYRNGKVCLSILGTWVGPSWSAAQSLQSLLLSIQSLMNEKPYHNEPGFEVERNHGEVERYNDIIKYETLRVAVCDALESNQCPADLYELKKRSFVDFYDYYATTAKQMASRLDGQTMMDPFSINKGKFDLRRLLQRLETLHSRISKELKNS